MARDYGRMLWRTMHGTEKFLGEIEDRHLANIYAYFRCDPARRRLFVKRNPGIMAWFRQEAKRRGIQQMLKYTVEYGPYPYQDPNSGEWMVYSPALKLVVPVTENILDRLPPDARDEFRVLEILGGIG